MGSPPQNENKLQHGIVCVVALEKKALERNKNRKLSDSERGLFPQSQVVPGHRAGVNGHSAGINSRENQLHCLPVPQTRL